MDKKYILIILVVIGFICSIGAVSAHQGMENPIVPDPNEVLPGDEVSGTVNMTVEVHWHNEKKYVNFTAENMDNRKVYWAKQDLSPSNKSSVSWDTSNAPNGEYWITITAVDVNNLEGKKEFKLILNNVPKESNLVLENITTVVNKSTNLVASLKDADSNPLFNKSVDFIIDGKTYSTKTTSSGAATIPFTPKEVRNYEVLVKFGGDNRYLTSQTIGMLKVMSNINATFVSVENIVGNNKAKILLTAHLQCPGLFDAASNKKIDFYMNNRHIGFNLTDINGEAKLDYTVNEPGGTYIYHVTYQNESGDNFTDYASLYVPQSEIFMTLSAVTYSIDGIFTVGNNFKLNYIVNNNGPDSANNTLVRYVLPNSLKYLSSVASQGAVAFNSKTGELLWNIGNVSKGSQKLEIMFQVLNSGRINLSPTISTDTYYESIASAVPTRVLTVNSYNLKSNDLIKYYGGTGKYRVYLYNNDGSAVFGANIKITINKQTLTLKTNNQGYVELAINLKAGSYPIKVTCNNLQKTNKIVIKPVLITKNIIKKKAKVIKFTAKVLNSNGKVLKNKKVTFKVNGKKYKVKTNKKGIATLKLKNLKVGKYVVYTSWGKSTNKNTIKVKK